VLAGGLGGRYDVIIVADMGSGQIVNGFTRGSVPPRYEGGIGTRGVRELDALVRGGGTLVTLYNASMFAIEQLYLPVRNVVADLEPTDYFMNGSIVEMEVDPSHPVSRPSIVNRRRSNGARRPGHRPAGIRKPAMQRFRRRPLSYVNESRDRIFRHDTGGESWFGPRNAA